MFSLSLCLSPLSFLILGGSVNLYHDHNLCLHLGATVDGANAQCINPESFSSFIGFLESIPFHNVSLGNGSFENDMPNLRYG